MNWDLHILQSQVLSLVSTIDAKLRPFSSDRGKDAKDALHCHVYVDVHVCAENQDTAKSEEFYFIVAVKV